MTPDAFASYENAFRPMLARLFDDLMVAFGVRFWPAGGCCNNVSRGHTYRQNVEINSLSFFNPSSEAVETVEVSFQPNINGQPLITLSGPNGTKVTILSDGDAAADAASVRAELFRVFNQPYLQDLVANI